MFKYIAIPRLTKEHIEISDDAELKVCLQDGTLVEGDTVYTVSSKSFVIQNDPVLILSKEHDNG